MSQDQIAGLALPAWQKAILDAWYTLGQRVFGPDPQWEGHYIFDMRDSIDWRRCLRVSGP
jgi:hypothetical protein